MYKIICVCVRVVFAYECVFGYAHTHTCLRLFKHYVFVVRRTAAAVRASLTSCPR